MKARILLTTVLATGLVWCSPVAAQNLAPYGSPSNYPAPSASANWGSYSIPNGPTMSGPTTSWPGSMSSTPRMASAPSGPGAVVGGNGVYGPVTTLPPTGPVMNGPVPNGPVGPGPIPGPAVGPGCGNPYMQAMSSPWDMNACDPGCAPSCFPAAPVCPKWFGGVYALYMDLGDDNCQYFGYAPTDPSRLYLPYDAADFNPAGGVEVRIGHTFCCCKYGLEFVYWGIYPSDQMATVYASDFGIMGFNNVLDYRDVYLDFTNGAAPNYNYRDTIYNQFENQTPMQAIRIKRSWDIQNFEINLLSGPLVPAGGCGCANPCGPAVGCDPCGMNYGAVPVGASYCGGSGCAPDCGCGPPQRLYAGWLFGVRYFNFDEYFCLVGENQDGYIDYNSPNNEFTHEVDVSNDLVGVQLGGHLDYFITKCWNLTAGSSFGVYGNQASVYQRVFNGNGPAYTNPNDPQWMNLYGSDTDVAFLGELRAGVGYRIGCHWRITGGYRAVAASGIARTIDQLPNGRMFANHDAMNCVNNDSYVVLHGVYAGAEFAW